MSPAGSSETGSGQSFQQAKSSRAEGEQRTCVASAFALPGQYLGPVLSGLSRLTSCLNALADAGSQLLFATRL